MTTSLPPRPPTVETIADGLRRVLADNPSPMTYWGTNTYLVGTGEVAVIDPGPADPAHLARICDTLDRNERITHIFVTHAHRDHSPGARLLADQTGAAVHAFGTATAGRSKKMSALATSGGLAGGEGVDAEFAPDEVMADNCVHRHGDWALRALWTPGHFGNHLSFAWEEKGYLFSGDLVMGWASSLVSPPDGDLGAFLHSLQRLAARDHDTTYFPGHGAPVTDPKSRVAELRAHREMRHDQIRAALGEAPGTAAELAFRIYTDTPAALLPAAARNVLAHLIEMTARSEATHAGDLRAETRFELAQS